MYTYIILSTTVAVIAMFFFSNMFNETQILFMYYTHTDLRTIIYTSPRIRSLRYDFVWCNFPTKYYYNGNHRSIVKFISKSTNISYILFISVIWFSDIMIMIRTTAKLYHVFTFEFVILLSFCTFFACATFYIGTVYFNKHDNISTSFRVPSVIGKLLDIRWSKYCESLILFSPRNIYTNKHWTTI